MDLLKVFKQEMDEALTHDDPRAAAIWCKAYRLVGEYLSPSRPLADFERFERDVVELIEVEKA